jgi:hypothetical protein
MRLLVPVLMIASLFQPVLGQSENQPPPARPGTSVEMPYLIAPMSKDGKLLGYAYISAKLVASSQSTAIAVRNKLAFIQDAFVRDVNGNPICKPDDPTTADSTVLATRLATDAKRIVGDNAVVRMVITQVQFAPLHPSQSTVGLLSPAPAAPISGMPATSTGAAAAQNPAPNPATSPPAKAATH